MRVVSNTARRYALAQARLRNERSRMPIGESMVLIAGIVDHFMALDEDPNAGFAVAEGARGSTDFLDGLPLLNDEKEEQRLLTQSIELLTKMTGKKPVGYRAPSWQFSFWTMKQIKDAGFLYDSSLMADDRPYEVLADGQPTGVVELPVEWILDDYPYFWMDRASSVRPTMTPDDVFSIWKAEFDGAYEERGLFILTMHPHIIGHRARIAMLDRLVTYMKSRPGVWFATHEQIARHVREGLR